jgi:hypothetical protein
LVLRPSEIIVRIGSMPSAVAGILTITLRRAMRSCSARAASSVAGPSWARPGSTSTLTKPSMPPASAYVGSNTSAAPAMSWSTIVQ